MRWLSIAAVIALWACGDNTALPDGPTAVAPQTFPFGPYALAPGQEIVNECVQITLHNDADLFVHTVELTTGQGFHHSNWFYVPESAFFGDDGTFPCDARNFTEPSAAIFGGVLFAQSTQDPHEIQAFPPGVAIRVPAHSKLVAQIHLLDATDQPLSLAPTIRLSALAPAEVTTQLSALSFEDQALALPPGQASRFTIDCDLAPEAQTVTGGPPTFRFYYALAHYHALGTGLRFEAVKPDGTAATIYSTQTHIGDTLGGPIDPPFDMTGYTRLRISCDYDNTTASTVRWGVGDQEMCVFLAFTDSPYKWGGGALMPDPPGPATVVDGVMTYSHACTVIAD